MGRGCWLERTILLWIKFCSRQQKRQREKKRSSPIHFLPAEVAFIWQNRSFIIRLLTAGTRLWTIFMIASLSPSHFLSTLFLRQHLHSRIICPMFNHYFDCLCCIFSPCQASAAPSLFSNSRILSLSLSLFPHLQPSPHKEAMRENHEEEVKRQK